MDSDRIPSEYDGTLAELRWTNSYRRSQMESNWNPIRIIDMKKPLTPKILSDPNNEFVKTLIYIYSMQSFIYSEFY